VQFSLIRIIAGTLALLVFLLLFGLPALSGTLLGAGYMPSWLMNAMGTFAVAQTWVMRVFVVGWVFFFGGCFASFLNVVAWRVPRGRGINGSSHCPHCGVQLSMGDNIPVLGWLRNRGRCRTCKTPITVRYLVVEIALGLVTLGLVALGVFWGGVNLPTGIGHDFRFAMLDNTVTDPDYSLIGIAGFHLVLVFGLFTAVVVRSEGLAVGLGALAGWGVGFALDRVAWFNGPYRSVDEVDNPAGSVEVTTGNRSVWSVADGVASLPLVGLFLGWQAVISVGVLLVLTLPLRMLVGPRACAGLQVQVFLATLVQLSCWRIVSLGEWL